jgi:hypothetical protein
MTINPALSDLAPLAGRWEMELYNAAFLPDPDARASGVIEIDWIENGSALRMRQGGSEHPPPSGSSAGTTARPTIWGSTPTIVACRASIG